MLSKLQNKRTMPIGRREEGFTIIEVLIVLAIAGLIMVIVFLAVPALQRNSRNTQRTNDVSRIAAAVNECTNNSNGNLNNCTPPGGVANYIDFAQNQQITGIGGPDLNNALFETETQCDDAGQNSQAGGGTRAFTLVYQVETSGGTQNRCISG